MDRNETDRDQIVLFALTPGNEAARRVVRNGVGASRQEIIYCSDDEARSSSRALVNIGYRPDKDDIVLQGGTEGGLTGPACSIIITPAGDVMVCDAGRKNHIKLLAQCPGGVVEPKFKIRYPNDSCVLPMNTNLDFNISFYTGELFEFRWLVGTGWANVKRLREALAGEYLLRAADDETTGARPFHPPSHAPLETVAGWTPEKIQSAAVRVKTTHAYRFMGQGWSGVVHLAVDVHDGEEYAVKSLNQAANLDAVMEGLVAVQFKAEADILVQLDHPNIIKIHHSQGWTDPRQVELFMTVCDGSATRLVTHNCYGRLAYSNKQHVPAFLTDCLSALAYLHSRGIIHRDVKLDNILYCDTTDGLSFILSDFGVTTAPEGAKGHRGDLCYAPPELADGTREAGPAADVYCFAIALLEFLGAVCPRCYRLTPCEWLRRMVASGCTHQDMEPVEHNAPGQACYARVKYLSTASKPRMAPTLARMLHRDPAKRPSATEALKGLAKDYKFRLP